MKYAPTDILLVFKSVQLKGYAPDSFVEVVRNTKTITQEVGCDGQVVRVFSADKSGKATFTLQAASQTNDQLSRIQQSDEVNYDGEGTFQLSDTNSTTLCHGDEACLEAPSEVKRGKGMPVQEWVLLIADLEMFSGGSFI